MFIQQWLQSELESWKDKALSSETEKLPSIWDARIALESCNIFSSILKVGICLLTVTHSSDKGCLHDYLSSNTVRQLTTAQRTSSHVQITQDKPRWTGWQRSSARGGRTPTNSKRLQDSQALKKLWLTLLVYFLFMTITMWEMTLLKNHG